MNMSKLAQMHPSMHVVTMLVVVPKSELPIMDTARMTAKNVRYGYSAITANTLVLAVEALLVFLDTLLNAISSSLLATSFSSLLRACLDSMRNSSISLLVADLHPESASLPATALVTAPHTRRMAIIHGSRLAPSMENIHHPFWSAYGTGPSQQMTWFYFLEFVSFCELAFVSLIVSEMLMERMDSFSDESDSSPKLN